MEKIFSIPLNPKLNKEQFDEFIKFLIEYKHLIYDVYFTSRIPPFMQDAMGDIFVIHEDYSYAIDMALQIQNGLGIPVSATFNNIQIPPTQTNLDIFIKNFKPLYDAGIRNATIPHTHWMATGQIKRAFPELLVKNTILRDVRSAQEIVNLANYGFDYINLDRDLMRDRDTLLHLKKAKEWIKENLGKDIKFSLLANEGCLGSCSMMVEHFEFNNTRAGDQPQYFNDPISRVSCPKWDIEDPAVHLKTADFPPWKEDWEEFFELGIDTFKMHGRESPTRLFQSMEIIRKWDRNEPILVEGFEQYLADNNLQEKPINIWRKKIKNCKFDCWDCQYCDKIYEAKSSWDNSELTKHVVDSIAKSGVPTIKLDIPGLTSRRVQTLLNLLAQGVDTYLEIGSYLGATVCAAMKDNPLTVITVDNWQAGIQPQNENIKLPDNDFEVFLENIKKHKGDSIVNVVNADMFGFNLEQLYGQVQLFFYDGPHDQATTKKAVEHFWPTFRNEAILVFDDANWKGVVDGAREAFNNIGANVTFEKMLLNSEENATEWWNGLYIVVIRKE
jgi:predicted O-methyltransferase YrrM